MNGIRPECDRILIVIAAPAEARRVRTALALPDAPRPGVWQIEAARSGFDLIETGVGKAQAAAATARVFDPGRYAGVISLGVGGALPGCGPGCGPGSGSRPGPELGDAVLATASIFADEGGITPDGFTPIERMGFPAGRFGEGGARICAGWRDALAPLTDSAGPIATVSTCAGTDERAGEIVRRTGAVAEAMEGAAVAAALAGLADPMPAFAEIRVISNTTGDRDRQRWDLPAALGRLESLTAEIVRIKDALLGG